MNRLRVLALVSVSAALVIGVSASASADAPAPKASTSAAPTCYEPARDQVLTTQQGIELFKACSAANAAAVPGWHWMGNYGDVYALANAANAWGAGPGELLTQIMSNGLLATFMYY
ncbi:hypothetical protein J2S55_008287 [Streptosporangium brasiliense]|uniref:Uncharacterized protein n=1 Tax=Streptosporangium brasiliense TaxID=47480 RepID=A0ABT9RIA1_9ACTN|nr:hypothetical protein [Streptosporangium brasiliense]